VPAAPGQTVEPRRDVTDDDRLTDGFCGHADRNAERKQ
jgi:hypothetical protein